MATTVRFSGDRLKQIRLRRGWTQSKLARRADIREAQVIRWENGHNVPSADGVAAVAGALEVEIGEFYERPEGDDDEEDDPAVRAVIDGLEQLGRLDLADDLRLWAKRRAAGEKRRSREVVR